MYYVCAFNVGSVTHYYLGFFANFKVSSISILLMASVSGQVQYSIEVPNVGYYHGGTLSAGGEVTLNLPRSVENKGIYLTTSSDNVTVIGQSSSGHSSDSFLVFPTMELDDDYVYYGISVPKSLEYVNSSVLIVGTESNTIMRLTVTQDVTTGVGDAIVRLSPGTQYSFVINRLQSILIGSPEDLSGTKIVTDRPVSVFSGHQCANVPSRVTACSHLIEQIPPTAMWGKIYYVAPLVNRTSYTIKVLAAHHLTTVNMYCNNTLQSYTINEGEFFNKTSRMNDYCAIYSNKEVLVVQFGHGGSEDFNNYGDPMMTLVPATNQYSNKLYFSTIHNPVTSGYNHYFNIIVMGQYYQPNMIYLVVGGVNMSLVTQQWVPIQVNNINEAYAAQVRIPEGRTQIIHTDAAAQMTAIVYGFTRHDGYGHMGGIHSQIGISKATGC